MIGKSINLQKKIIEGKIIWHEKMDDIFDMQFPQLAHCLSIQSVALSLIVLIPIPFQLCQWAIARW